MKRPPFDASIKSTNDGVALSSPCHNRIAVKLNLRHEALAGCLTMKYMSVKWIHEFSGEPVQILSEIDSKNWERRKVEIFRDGSMSFASKSKFTRTSGLSVEPLPSLEE